MNELLNVRVLIIFVLCYIIGSFPVAYLLVKVKSKKDITKEGSGNVGTLNSFLVTKSKTVGVAVLLIDLLKGMLPIYYLFHVLEAPYLVVMISACMLILGHNYPVWLKFKGGRGLAPGAGIFIILNFYIILGWFLMWLVVFVFKKKVLPANTAATLSIPLYVFIITRFSFLQLNSGSNGYSLLYFTVFSIIITLIILSRHTEVFKEIFSNKSKA